MSLIRSVSVRGGACLVLALGCAMGKAEAADGNARVRLEPRAAKRPARAAASIRVDTSLVLIPVTVTNTFGAPFSGLKRETFRLYENGIEQPVKYFTAEDAPVSLGVVFDASRSMEGKLEQSREAVLRFLASGRRGDEFLVVEFNDAPRLACSFTSDTEKIGQSLAGIRPKNWTALLDAVCMAVHQMKRAKNSRKALFILSDGADNNSRYTETEMKALVREADVCIYAIVLTGGGLFKRHVRLLRQLAEETGGRMYEAAGAAELPDAVAKISAAIRNQYLLGYAPENPRRDGLYRKVRVALNPVADAPPLRASWRAGYYAPEE